MNKMMPVISHHDYRNLLERWVLSAQQDCYSLPERPDLLCYGTGFNGWGVQTHQKAFAAFAVLAADPDLDTGRTGLSREQLRNMACRMLRFNLESHVSGSYYCTDRTSWGHTWISALGLERMMHGVEAIWPCLNEQDKVSLRRLLVSECDWLLDHYPVVAGPVINNKPESNLWNGCLLHRTAVLFPDTPRVDIYREKGTRFLLNGISIAADALSRRMYDGKPLSDWHVGHNFFDSFALNHHGYLNIGYSIICLSQVALLHFGLKQKAAIPDALYLHAADLWQQVRSCYFPDGRLNRIGGDTRVRYSYCQDYAIPVWLLMADWLEDADCPGWEQGWLEQVRREMDHNQDQAFLSERCRDLRQQSLLYYTRLESDRAVSLSYGAFWRRLQPILAEKQPEEAGRTVSWYDSYHGSCLQKGPRRVASWTWRAAELPQGSCLPAGASHMAEWRYNLAGRIRGTGRSHNFELVTHQEQVFPGGFLTYGQLNACSQSFVSEQQEQDILARQQIACAVLPDDSSMIVLQYARTDRRSLITAVQGIFLNMPNDLFNDNSRSYFYGGKQHVLQGYGSRSELIDTKSYHLNIDDRLSLIKIYGSGDLQIRRPGRRQVGLRHPWLGDDPGMLYADEICCPCSFSFQDAAPGSVLIDTGFLLQADYDHQQTLEYVAARKARFIPLRQQSLRVKAVRVQGQDGCDYLLAANWGSDTIHVALPLPDCQGAYDLGNREHCRLQGAALPASIAGRSARLWKLQGSDTACSG